MLRVSRAMVRSRSVLCSVRHVSLVSPFSFRVTQSFAVRTANHPATFPTGPRHCYQWPPNHLFPLPTLVLRLPMCHALIDLPWYCSLPSRRSLSSAPVHLPSNLPRVFSRLSLGFRIESSLLQNRIQLFWLFARDTKW